MDEVPDTNEAEPLRKRRPAKISGKPTFISKSELDHEMRIDCKTVDDWIITGSIPPPHSRPGERTARWLRSWFDHYVATGQWPKDS
jgi:hypothetical protein